MGHSRCPRCLVCSSCLCCSDHNLFFQPTERLCWIEFCYHIKHRSKWSHHSLQVRETQLLLSSFSKHSWNELSSFFVESQQSTLGRRSHCWLPSCFIPPELPHILNKDLSLLAACMYYDADLLGTIQKGYFGGRSLGRTSKKCKLFWDMSRNRCWGFCWKQQSYSLYCNAIYCRQIHSSVWSLAQHVWDFYHCHKKSEPMHPSLHLIWFLDCTWAGDLKTVEQKTLCLTEQASSWDQQNAVCEWDLPAGLRSTVQVSGMNGAEPLRFLLPMATCRVSSQLLWQAWQCVVLSTVPFHREPAHCIPSGGSLWDSERSQVHQSMGDWSVAGGPELGSGQQTRAADKLCLGQGTRSKSTVPIWIPLPVWW